MNKIHYTLNNEHPEDAIHKAKTFINELEEVQKVYFDNLVYQLNVNKDGEEWLFDYIYNTFDEYDGFEDYLEKFKKNYDDMVSYDTMFNNSVDNFLSSDFGEFSPMTHMSSYEPDLETAFPPAYKDIL